MTTEVLKLDPTTPDPAAIARAAGLLRAARLVAFPTETVYGLGADALNPAAVARIFAAKGRPATNPVIVHVADAAQVINVAAAWPATAALLAERFWPGPLTIVVTKGPAVPDIVTAGGPTVAVRCPNHPIARALIREAGVPVAAPSANRSTELSPTRAEHVLKGLGGRIDLILDGGPCPGGIESTVVDVTGDAVRVLRPGLVTGPMLEEVLASRGCKPPVLSSTSRGVDAGEPARSPGQMVKHYSPRTPIVLAEDAETAQRRLREAGLRVAAVAFGDPADAAANLYAVLHDLDDGQYDRIVVELPPDTPAWAAVRDRLMRAASNDLGERGASAPC